MTVSGLITGSIYFELKGKAYEDHPRIFKSIIIGGFFVVLPLLVIFLVFGEVIELLVQYTDPIAELLPFDGMTNASLAILIVVVEAVVICSVAGIIVRTRFGRSLISWLERTVFNKIPIYTMIKNLMQRFAGHTGAQFIPAEVDLYDSDGRVLGLIVEKLSDGRVAVFIPAVPAVTVGQLHLLLKARVTYLTLH